MSKFSLIKSKLDRRKAIFLLSFSMFVTGGAGLIYEYLLSTVSTYILGNSVQQFSIIIGLMMFMMAIAGFIQPFINSNNLIEKFILAEIILSLVGGFATISIYFAFAYFNHHFTLVLYAFVLCIGFLIGLEIPLATRINDNFLSLSKNIASVWSLDYIGSLVGSLLFALVLIKVFAITQISFMISLLNLSVATITFAFFASKGLIRQKFIFGLMLFCTFVLLLVGLFNNVEWNFELEQNLYKDKIVFEKTTSYQRLVLTYNTRINDYRFYINGNLQFSSIDEKIYHEMLVHPIMEISPYHQDVLVLGGGDGLALRELNKYEIDEVNLVDLDPDVVKVFSTNPDLVFLNGGSFLNSKVHTSYFDLQANGTEKLYQSTGKITVVNGTDMLRVQKIADVNVFTMDADRFLDDVDGYFDLAIIDLPDPSSIELSKLYSKEFYLKLYNVLNDRGLFVLQATSPYHAKESYLCIKRTIESAGFMTVPYHVNVPSFGEWGFIIGYKNLSADYIGRRIDDLEFDVDTEYITGDVFRSSLIFPKGWLDTNNTDVNTLMRPVLLNYYLDESWKII